MTSHNEQLEPDLEHLWSAGPSEPVARGLHTRIQAALAGVTEEAPATDFGSRLRRLPRAIAFLAVGLAGAATALAAVAVAGTMTGVVRLPGSEGNAYVISPGASCRTADFEIRSVEWPAAPEAGGVRVFFEAHAGVNCVIDHGIYADVSDANGDGLVSSVFGVGIRDPIQVTPGSRWEFDVYWSGYCATAGGPTSLPAHPARPLQLSVALGLQGTVAGVPSTVSDTVAFVSVPGEIAPDSCAGSQGDSPFLLAPAGFRAAAG